MESKPLSFSQGPQIYQSRFGPTYRVSYGCSVGLLVGCILMILITWHLVWRGDLKQKQDREEELGSAEVVNVNVNVKNVEDGKA
jgi:peptidoglycan biosynthesis protein MviN/MurJ (putative lipid II flippase)